MSVAFYGDYDTTETVKIPFNTFSSNDPSASVTITNLVAGDIEIHKDGGLTQRSSDAGVTIVIDFDSVAGNHIASIDLSDNTDAGFYAAGSRYQVRMEGTTVYAGTINAWIGAFSIGCTLRPTTAGRTLDIQATGEVDANLTMMGGGAQSATDLKDFADAGYDPGTNKVQGVVLTDTCTTNTDLVSAASVVNEFETQSQADPTGFHVNVLEIGGTAQTANDNGADINAILTDTGELQTDWTNAGRLDAILDIIAADTTTDIPALVATAQADLDIITGADGAIIVSTQDLTATMKTSVNTEADTALSDIKLDHLIAVADADDVVNDSIIAKMVSSAGTADWSGFVNTSDSLQATRDKLTDIETDTAEIGTAGAGLTNIDLPNQTMDITGNLSGSVGSLTGHTVQTADHTADITAIKAVTDALTAAAATKLALSIGTMQAGTVSHDNTAASTTVFYSDDITEATADHYNGRIVLFTSGVLQYQATDITDYALDTGEGKFTVTALTEAPADNVTFIIV